MYFEREYNLTDSNGQCHGLQRDIIYSWPKYKLHIIIYHVHGMQQYTIKAQHVTEQCNYNLTILCSRPYYYESVFLYNFYTTSNWHFLYEDFGQWLAFFLIPMLGQHEWTAIQNKSKFDNWCSSYWKRFSVHLLFHVFIKCFYYGINQIKCKIHNFRLDLDSLFLHHTLNYLLPLFPRCLWCLFCLLTLLWGFPGGPTEFPERIVVHT